MFYSTVISPKEALREKPFWYILIIVLWTFYAYVFRLYSPARSSDLSNTIKRAYLVAILTAITYLFFPFYSPVFPKHRLPAFFLISQMLIFLMAWRVAYAYLFSEPVLRLRAIVVGAGWSGRMIVRTLTSDHEIYHRTAYHLYGYIDDDENKIGKEYDGLKVLGNSERLAKYVRRLKIDEVIIATPQDDLIKGELYNQIMKCQEAGAEITTVNDLYETVTGKVLVKQKNGEYLLTYPYASSEAKRLYMALNRLINVTIGVFGVLIVLLVVPFVWLANLIVSPGPLLYSQVRVGKNGREFKIYKFRSMIVDAEKGTGPVWAQKGDKRVTPIGKFMRKTRIDELPQFWNLFRGDMNLIGPRPERPAIVEDLKETIPFFHLRHLTKPGITGWAQVNYRYGSTVDDALVKLQYDLYYIKYRSILLDLKILLRTISVVLKFKGT